MRVSAGRPTWEGFGVELLAEVTENCRKYARPFRYSAPAFYRQTESQRGCADVGRGNWTGAGFAQCGVVRSGARGWGRVGQARALFLNGFWEKEKGKGRGRGRLWARARVGTQGRPGRRDVG